MKILVTGGAGFIGSAYIRHLILNTEHSVVNIDKLTYAASLESIEEVSSSERYSFAQVDIVDRDAVKSLFTEYQPDAVVHLAAESHVDRSIDSPGEFIQTNIVGTFNLLECALSYYEGLEAARKEKFRFHHVSTDEVYGSLGENGLFTEETAYAPNSPYSASKASSDHLVRAWCHTFGLPTVLTNCSNNYGPFQFPEKLIPVMVLKALDDQPLPVYGQGLNIRDWLFVDDHARALLCVLENGIVGEEYNIGGHNEWKNIDVVKEVCRIVDELSPSSSVPDRTALITYVEDRPGHDQRYAIDAGKIQRELGWVPEETFSTGLRKTIQWYLENREWCELVQNRNTSAGQRLGLRKG